MTPPSTEAIIAYLRQFVSDTRWNRFHEVLNERTNHIRVVLENVYQPHNSSAVLRSCDCFGIQNVHYLEGRNSMRIAPHVAMGSSNWLTLHKHNTTIHSTTSVLNELKDKGYRIIGTTPHTSTTIHELPIDQPFVLVFGSEKQGISEDVKSQADAYVKVPMYGFTESYNISVSAALCLYELTNRLRQSQINYQLTLEEKNEVLLNWLYYTLDNCDLLVNRFIEEKQVRSNSISQ